MSLNLLLDTLRVHAEPIGFWAAVFTTGSFAPQVIEAWRTGGQGLSWMMLVLFGLGTALWFLYGVLRLSAPVMAANGLTFLQILVILAVKLRHSMRPPAQNRV